MQGLGSVSKQAAVTQFGYKLLHLGRSQKEIDFWKRLEELVLVAFDHAAHRDYSLAATSRLESRGFNHRVDRFLLRSVDEAASVDDDYVGIFEVGSVFRRVVRELRQITLAVDGVLVAAECDYPDFHGKVGSGRMDSRAILNGSS